jgi:hypothetical protein
MYFTHGNHVNVTTKGEFNSNIRHGQGRQPSVIQRVIIIGLVFALQIDRKR